MRIRTHRLLALTSSVLVGFAFVAHADEAADRVALDAASQAWIAAFNARDADAMAALATEDVVVLMPDVGPASGRDKARAAWQQAVSKSEARISSASKEIVLVGDLAWRIGALVSKQPNGMTISRGQTLEIWKRVDGRWKIHRMMSSGNLAGSPILQPRPVPNQPVLDKPGD